MKTRLKMLAVAVFVGGLLFGARGQINLNANPINIRTPSNAANGWTHHYGDLRLDGGTAGNGWGWLWCNSVRVNDLLLINGHTTMFNNLEVYRDLQVFGSKNFIHPHPTDSSKVIRYVAIESAEALTLSRGTAKTVNGEATITLPQHFSMVTCKDAPITVHLTPEGAPVLLYVKQKSTEQVVVAMRPSDFSEFRDVEFSFQVTGVRDGFEKLETIVNIDALNTPTPARDDVQKRIDAHIERARMREEQILEQRNK